MVQTRSKNTNTNINPDAALRRRGAKREHEEASDSFAHRRQKAPPPQQQDVVALLKPLLQIFTLIVQQQTLMVQQQMLLQQQTFLPHAAAYASGQVNPTIAPMVPPQGTPLVQPTPGNLAGLRNVPVAPAPQSVPVPVLVAASSYVTTEDVKRLLRKEKTEPVRN